MKSRPQLNLESGRRTSHWPPLLCGGAWRRAGRGGVTVSFTSWPSSRGDVHPLPPQGPPLATGPWTTDPSIGFPPWTLKASWRVSRAEEESRAARCPQHHHAGPGRDDRGPVGTGFQDQWSQWGVRAPHLTLVLPGAIPPHPAVPGRHRHAVPSLLCVVLMTVTLRHGPARHGQPAQGLDALTRTRHGRCELGQARWT